MKPRPVIAASGVALVSIGLTALGAQLAGPATVRFSQEGLLRGLNRLNEPAAAAAIPYDPSSYNLPYGVYFSDLDGDGLLDVFAINHGQVPHRSGLWLNSGAGSFGPNLYTVAVSGWNLSQTGWIEALPDLNGDGRADLYFLGWNETGAFCPNAGVSTQNGWTGPTFPCTPAPYMLSLADVTGDGRVDVESYDPTVPFDNYAAVTRTLPVVWRINNGADDASTFAIVKDAFALAGTAEAGALLDFNRDGLPDRIEGIPAPAGQRGPYFLGSLGTRLLLGQSNGTYLAVTSGLEAVRDPVQKIEDINEDGCLDVGFDPTRYRQNPYWYLQDRDGLGRCTARFHGVSRLSAELPYFPGFARYSLDVDNSGTLDKVVVVNSSYGDNEGFPRGVHVFLKQPEGNYVEATGTGIDLQEAYYTSLQPGDWNNDGLVDISAQGPLAQPSTDGGIALFTNQTVTANHWLKVRLPGVQGPMARPARIELFEPGRAGDPAALVTPAQVLKQGLHYPSLAYHFGLGSRSAVDVRVSFPDGTVVTQPVAVVDQTIAITATANSVPTARATASPTVANIGASVSFDGSTSFDSDGSVVSWRWDFGDGTGATGARVSHAYATLGTFPARLVVTDNRGASGSVTVSVQVRDGTAPQALLSQATFLPQVSDNVGVASVQWFVDGALRATTTLAPFPFTLDLQGLTAGAHQISARAVDAAGNFTDAAALTITK